MSASIGYHLHFGFSDMLEMNMDEMERFYKICRDINEKIKR